jgi:hypothetical protein
MATIISEEHGLFFVITDDYLSEKEPEPLTLAYFKYKEDAEEFINEQNKLDDDASGQLFRDDLDIEEPEYDYNDDYDHRDEPKGYGSGYGCD